MAENTENKVLLKTSDGAEFWMDKEVRGQLRLSDFESVTHRFLLCA